MIRFIDGDIEVPLSEVFEVDGTIIRAAKPVDGAYPCYGCYFYRKDCRRLLCQDDMRQDEIDIYFEVVKEKEVKK